MKPLPSSSIRPSGAAIRVLFFVGSGLAFIAGVQLFVFSEQTAHYFSWTIAVPLTAAFIGANFWGSTLLFFLAGRQKVWANARFAMTTILLFTPLLLIATLLHIGLFHFGSSDPLTLFVTWAWLIVYVALPPLAIVLLLVQLRTPGIDPVREAPLPWWIQTMLATQGIVMTAFGIMLLLVPLAVAPLWPWKLTALTGQVVGAWLLSLGIAAIQVCFENDWRRVRIGMMGYAVLGILQLVALARYSNAVDWSQPSTWFYLIFVLSISVVSIYSWRVSMSSLRTVAQ